MDNQLNGAFRLTLEDVVYANIGEGEKGVYLLSNGERSVNNRLFVTYIGKTDDLLQSLRAQIAKNEGYLYFWYEKADTSKAAEELAHKYFELYSKVHDLKTNL